MARAPYEELDLRHEFAHLLAGKSTKTAATGAALFDSSMQQIVCRLVVRPRPHVEAYSALPDPLAGFKGDWKENVKDGEDGRKGEDRRGGKGRGGERKDGSSSFAPGKKTMAPLVDIVMLRSP